MDSQPLCFACSFFASNFLFSVLWMCGNVWKSRTVVFPSLLLQGTEDACLISCLDVTLVVFALVTTGDGYDSGVKCEGGVGYEDGVGCD